MPRLHGRKSPRILWAVNNSHELSCHRAAGSTYPDSRRPGFRIQQWALGRAPAPELGIFELGNFVAESGHLGSKIRDFCQDGLLCVFDGGLRGVADTLNEP